MKTRLALPAAAAALSLLVLAGAARGDAVTLQYKPTPGESQIYNRQITTTVEAHAGDKSQRTVSEIRSNREETVLESRAEPASIRLVILDFNTAERLLARDEDGKSRLEEIPESNRSRDLPPSLAVVWRDARGRTLEQPTQFTDPMAAMDAIHNEMQSLPEGPVKAGDTWSRQVDFGAAKATVSTTFVKEREEGGTPCAVLEATATVVFGGDLAERVQIEKMTSTMAVALDGSGRRSQTVSTTLVEKSDQAEQRIQRESKETLAQINRLDTTALEKTKADVARLDAAMEKAKAGDLDGGVQWLEAYLKENPEGSWTGAVGVLRNRMMQERLLTQPVEAPRLREILRDLQTARDRATSQGGGAQIAQVDQTLLQVAGVNAKTLLADSANADPLIRDLAAFGLTFVQSEEAAGRLVAMTEDASSQVRGTAALGLALRTKTVDRKRLLGLLKDADARVQGAAALLAARTVKKDDPEAAAVVTCLIENLKSPGPWTRINTAAALASVASPGSAAVGALITAYNAETDTRLQPAYLEVLRAITGVEAKELGPYEVWLKDHPEAPAPTATEPPAPAPTPAKAPSPAQKSGTSKSVPKG
jgi:hypothetical protein